MINHPKTSLLATLTGAQLYDDKVPSPLAAKLIEVLGYPVERALPKSTITFERFAGSTEKIKIVVNSPSGDQSSSVFARRELPEPVQRQLTLLLPSDPHAKSNVLTSSTIVHLPKNEKLRATFEHFDTHLTDLLHVSSIYPHIRLSVIRSTINSILGGEVFTTSGVSESALHNPKIRTTAAGIAACDTLIQKEKEVVRRHSLYQDLVKAIATDNQFAVGEAVLNVFGIERVRRSPPVLYHGVRIPHDPDNVVDYVKRVHAIATEGVRPSKEGPHYPGFDETRPAFFVDSPAKTHGALFLAMNVPSRLSVFTVDTIEWVVFSPGPIQATYSIVLKTPNTLSADPEGTSRLPPNSDAFYRALRGELEEQRIPFKLLETHNSIVPAV